MADMTTAMMAATALAAVNAVLLIALTTVWLRNYRTFKTPLLLGLVAFAAVLAVQNLAAIYFFFSTKMLYSGDAAVQQAVLVLRALQLIAVGALSWATLK